MPRAYQVWRRKFCSLVLWRPDEPITGRLAVTVHVFTKSGKMRPDLDNVGGAVLDALQDASIIANDREAVRLAFAIYKDAGKPGILVSAEIEP